MVAISTRRACSSAAISPRSGSLVALAGKLQSSDKVSSRWSRPRGRGVGRDLGAQALLQAQHRDLVLADLAEQALLAGHHHAAAVCPLLVDEDLGEPQAFGRRLGALGEERHALGADEGAAEDR